MSPLREEQNRQTAELTQLDARFAELVTNAGRSSSEFPPPTERRPRPTLLEQCPKNYAEAREYVYRCFQTRDSDDPELLALGDHVKALGYAELISLDHQAAAVVRKA
jgi:hypothetical protein